MREEGAKSARGRVREDKDKLEGFEQHRDYMSHTMGESPRKMSKKTDLDAVRETENEDGNKRKR